MTFYRIVIEGPRTNKTRYITTDLKRFCDESYKSGDQFQTDVCKDHQPCNVLRGMFIKELFPIKLTDVTSVRLHHVSKPSFIALKSNQIQFKSAAEQAVTQ